MCDTVLVLGFAAIVFASYRFLLFGSGVIDRLFKSNKQSIVTGDKPDIDDLYEHISSRKHPFKKL